jgi:hypothetical protein
MKTIDFRNKKFSEIQKILRKEFNLSIKLTKRIANEIKALPKYKRELTPQALVDLLKNQELTTHLHKEQMGQMNTFKFPNYYDETRLSYMQFLNRDDHNNKKDFQDMTINEWVHYFVDTFKYPKHVAKKCGRSMYEYLRENIRYDEIPDKKYPLYPLIESDE